MRPRWRSADHCDMTPLTSIETNCPSCRSNELMSVRLALGEGGLPLEFDFCTQCEWRGWDSSGQNLSLSSILGLASRR